MLILRNLNIRNKLIVVILSVSLISTTIGFTFLLIDRINEVKKSVIEESELIAKVVGDNVIPALEFNYTDRADEILKQFENSPKIISAIVFTKDLKKFGAYHKGSDSFEIGKIHLEKFHFFNDDILQLFEPIIFNGQVYGVMYLRTNTSLSTNIRGQIYLILTVFLIITILSLILAYFTQGLISGPILKLAANAQDVVAKNDYSIHLRSDTNDEVGKLVKSFNEMLEHLREKENQRDLAELEIKVINKNLEVTVEKRTSELNKAYNDLKEFAYVTSHDLKSPLRGIGQPAQWLLQDYKDKLDNEGVELLEIMLNRVNRMDKLIDGIQNYLQIGNLDKKGEIVNLNILVNDVLRYIEKPKNIDIIISNNLPIIKADKMRIERLFFNLIENSIRFMDKSKGKITISSTESDLYWKFKVADNGLGISRVYHTKVFELFQTLETKDKAIGIGIGLAIAKKIVEIYEGEISFNSSVKEGCEINFSIHK